MRGPPRCRARPADVGDAIDRLEAPAQGQRAGLQGADEARPVLAVFAVFANLDLRRGILDVVQFDLQLMLKLKQKFVHLDIG